MVSWLIKMIQENYNTPLDHTRSAIPRQRQLWKESHQKAGW